jgi:hypothetical protein
MKTAKITSVKFSTRWQSPSGSYVYYHDLTLDNGDTGTCGRNKECPDDMKVGNAINYEINEKRIKFISHIKDFKKNNRYSPKDYKKSPSDFIGYAYSYAKDLVIAGKVGDKDLQDLEKIATDIFTHIKQLLVEDDENIEGSEKDDKTPSNSEKVEENKGTKQTQNKEPRKNSKRY